MILLFHLALLLQGFLPTCLQCSRHESILGLHGLILSLGPADLVLHPFEFLMPVIVQALALLLDVLDGAQAEFQAGRFQGTQ